MAGRIDIDVLSLTSSEPLKFAKISEIEKVATVYPEDYLLLSNDNDGNDKTRSVRLTDIAAFFSEVNTNMQWFIPVVKGSVISWKWSSIVDAIAPIDIGSMIGLADSSTDGLLSALDKVKLDSIEYGAKNYVLEPATKEKLGGVKPDGVSIVADENGVISSVTGMPLCTQCVLDADAWDPDSFTQKITMEVNVNNRNVIDYPPECIQVVSQHHVLAIKEEVDGITFQCDAIPVNDITVYVTSMGVTKNVN